MSEILNPFELYFGQDGRPISAGSLYIGVAGLDPQLNPIDVFYDREMTVPAQQPLNISGGYVWNCCAPTKVFAEPADYSLKVLGKNGEQVFYCQTVELLDDASRISYLAPFFGAQTRTQADKNADVVSIKDFGAVGADDTTPLLNAVVSSKRVLVNTATSAINQAIISQSVDLTGDAVLTQPNINKHTVVAGFAKSTAGSIAGTLIPKMRFNHMSFGAMGASTSDDFAALAITSADGGISSFNNFEGGVENGILISVSDEKYGVPNFGARDTLILGDRFVSPKRFAVQNLQAQYTRMIGIARHSNGDNTTVPSGGTNNSGFNGGVRLAGISRGNIVAASNLRDAWTCVEIQKGCSFNVLSGNFYENSYSNTINTSSGTSGASQGNTHSGFIILNAGASGIRARHTVAGRFSGGIFGTGKNGLGVGDGIDARNFSGTGVKHYRLGFTGGSGVVPAVGTTITQGTASATLVSVDKVDLQIAEAGAAMPTAGEIVVKDVTGDFFAAGALAGITATVTRSYAADGRHRIDLTTGDVLGLSAAIASDCNLVDLIAIDGGAAVSDISGSHNNVRLVIADNKVSTKLFISGSNNIVHITDNTLTSRTTVSVTGTSNTVIISSANGSVSVSGNANNVQADCKTLGVSGNDNVFTGRCTALSKGAGTGNKYDGLFRGIYRAVVTATTDAGGVINLTHNLIVAAVSVRASVVGATPYVVNTINPAVNLTTASVKVFDMAGAVVASTSVTLDVLISI